MKLRAASELVNQTGNKWLAAPTMLRFYCLIPLYSNNVELGVSYS